MKTLGEFLKEYEAGGGTYPVKVTIWHNPDYWYEILVEPRGGYAVGYEQTGAHQVYGIRSERNWRLWTPPKKVRKEKRYAWLVSEFKFGVLELLFHDNPAITKICSTPGKELLRCERAPWLDGEVEIEE